MKKKESETQSMTVSEYETEVLSLFGYTLFVLQLVEWHLSKCLYLSMADGRYYDDSMLDSIETAHGKKTLGYFVARVMEHHNLRPNFEKRLKKYLADRNALIHHLLLKPGYNIGTATGLKRVHRFLSHFFRESQFFLDTFQGLYLAWSSHSNGQERPDPSTVPSEHWDRLLAILQTKVIRRSNQAL